MNSDLKNRISLPKPIPLQLSVIIVNFNVKYFLEQCLYSVLQAGKNISMEIFVVDNHSEDGSREFFSARFEKVRFIWNEVNNGFSSANNQALKLATGKYILFLNPDTILPEDCLEKCLDFFQQQNNAGALGIRMIDGSGNFLKESKRGFPSPFVSLCKLSGLTTIFPHSRFFARYYLGHLDQHKNHKVDVLAGAFMLVDKKVLDQTGGFDESFFMYGEDIDLSYRIQKAGFSNWYFSESTIIHFKGESTKKQSLTYIRLFYGAMGLFAKKHYSNGIATFYNLLIQGAIGIKSLGHALGFRPKQLPNNEEMDKAKSRCFIIAEKKEFDTMKSILRSTSPQKLVYRIDPHDPATDDALGNVEHLPLLVGKLQSKEIIFCTNGFSVKETINLIQRLPPGINFFSFHVKGSRSIVGSTDKDRSGNYIALD